MSFVRKAVNLLTADAESCGFDLRPTKPGLVAPGAWAKQAALCFRFLEEGVHVGSEPAVVLEEEAVRRVWVDRDPRVREEPRQ
jgi:hypothetical protein